MKIFCGKSGGFSLIEILVVMAIISILISSTLIAIGDYQEKANDTTCKVNLSQARKAAMMIYMDENSYELVCVDGTLNEDYRDLEAIEDDIEKVTGEEPECHSSRKEYCSRTELSSGRYFCVDSTGVAEEMDEDYCGGGYGKNCIDSQ